MKIAKIIGVILAAAIAYIVGLAVMGALAPALHLPTVKPIASVDPQSAFLSLAMSSPLLIIGLIPLAAGLRGAWIQRCAAIAVLVYVTVGLNTLLELKTFSTLLDGSPWLASLMFVLPCLVTAAIVTYAFKAETSAERGFGNFGSGGWAWRIALGWLAFPVIYWTFGMLIAPIVVPYYQTANELGLHIPAVPELLRTVFVRSATFLLASLPLIALWTKSRGRLIFALGLAHAMTVGIFQLVQATFFPVLIRTTHSIEITADSFVYAAVLALLFARKSKAAEPVLSKPMAA